MRLLKGNLIKYLTWPHGSKISIGLTQMTIISKNTVISSDVSYTQQIEIAKGATLTIMPGVSVNLNGHSIIVAGSLNLAGSADNFSNISNGSIYSLSSASVTATHTNFTHISVSQPYVFENSFQASYSVFDSSSFYSTASSEFTSVLFKNTPIEIWASRGASFTHSTFWYSPLNTADYFSKTVTVTESNFIGTGKVITMLNSGSSEDRHNLSIANSYMGGSTGKAIEKKVWDADDSVLISTNISPRSFADSPYLNSTDGFQVGNTLITLEQLKTGINMVTGTIGNDSLSGSAGSDRLIGDLGADILTGGLGADRFKFNAEAETGITTTTQDIITDFRRGQGDKIDLSAIDADTALAGDNAFSAPTVGRIFSGIFAYPGELYFDKTAHILYGNDDADAEADFSIMLAGVKSLMAEDFVL